MAFYRLRHGPTGKIWDVELPDDADFDLLFASGWRLQAHFTNPGDKPVYTTPTLPPAEATRLPPPSVQPPPTVPPPFEDLLGTLTVKGRNLAPPSTVQQTFANQQRPQSFGPVTSEQAQFLSEEPRIAWNRAFNLPSVGQNPFQAWLARQVGPAYAAYAAGNLLDQMSGAQGTSFGSYLGASDLGAAPGRALAALRTLRGQPSEEQGRFLDQFLGEDIGARLPDLFQSALHARGFASPFARAAARQLPSLEDEWRTRSLGGTVESQGTLLDYLMNRLRL